jgi:hypothetical protein
MVLLEGLYGQSFGLDGTHCPDARFNTADRGQDRNAALNSGAANFDFVLSGSLAARGIDDEANLVVLDHIDDVRPSFAQLEKPMHGQTGSSKRGSGTACRIYSEP